MFLNVLQASLTQQANKLASRRAPPLWAIVAMILLGFNEGVSLVYNPLLLLFIAVGLLFIRTLYVELDVDGEMQRGALPGMMALGRCWIWP